MESVWPPWMRANNDAALMGCAQEAACGALATLAIAPDFAAKAGEAGAMGPIVAALCLHANNADMQARYQPQPAPPASASGSGSSAA